MGLGIGFLFGLLGSDVFSLGLKIRSLGMVVCRSVWVCALLKVFVSIWLLGFQAKDGLLNEHFQVLCF